MFYGRVLLVVIFQPDLRQQVNTRIPSSLACGIQPAISGLECDVTELERQVLAQKAPTR